MSAGKAMTHIDAINAAMTSSRLVEHAEHGPLVELCRTLARQMDAAGDEPSTRLSAAYLSALKDVRRATVTLPAKKSGGKLGHLRAANKQFGNAE